MWKGRVANKDLYIIYQFKIKNYEFYKLKQFEPPCNLITVAVT